MPDNPDDDRDEQPPGWTRHIDDPQAAEFQQWNDAIDDLRELVETLDDADLHRDEDRREAEHALFTELPDTELFLRDAWDDLSVTD